MSAAANCPICGEPLEAPGAPCLRCGHTQLVDLSVPGPLDDRARFQAARVVAEFGPPAPDFSTARARLAAGAPVLVAVSPAFAQQAADALARAGIAIALRPASSLGGVARTVAPARRRTVSAPFVFGFLAAIAFATWYARAQWVPPARPAAQATAPDAAALRRVLESSASLECGDRGGAGFFVGPETVVSNAHVVCDGNDKPVKVRLKDGRELFGFTERRDEILDFAVVHVLGEPKVRPLPLGETAALHEGDAVHFVGSPKGLEFTLHEGKVGYVGRVRFGIGYTQLNGTVNPGNSGGPLLNARGQVVGLVTLKVTDTEGIGLALPIEYGIPPTAPEAIARWQGLLAKVAEEDQREVERFKAALSTPALIAVIAGPTSQPHGILLAVGSERPPGRLIELTFRTPNGACPVAARAQVWMPLADLPSGSSNQKARQLFTWLQKSGAGSAAYVSVAPLRAATCEVRLLAQGGKLGNDDLSEVGRSVLIAAGDLIGAGAEPASSVRR